MFKKCVKWIDSEIKESLNAGSLTQTLTLKLQDGMAVVNPAYKEKLSAEDLELAKEDDESNQKLNHIEIELEEIAQGVRDNLTSIISRGEKFDSLTQKSEQLKSVSSSLKKKAVQIRKDSQGFNILGLLSALLSWAFSDPKQAAMTVGGVVLVMVVF